MRKRFLIESVAPNGQTTTREADEVIEAWDHHAYFTKAAPANEVRVIDRDEVSA